MADCKRVVNTKILKRGDYEFDRLSDGKDTVTIYDITMRHHPSFFIDGDLLVHNSVDDKEDRYGNLSDYNLIDYYTLEIDDGKLRRTKRNMDDPDEAPDIISLFNPPSSHLPGVRYENFWIGMDVGFVRDPSVIVVFAEEYKSKTKPSTLRLLSKITLTRVEPPWQMELMVHICDYYKPKAFSMDSTGNGLALFGFWQEEARGQNGDKAREALKVRKGYNFSEKIVIEYQDSEVAKSEDLQKREIRQVVKDAATETLRMLIDTHRLILPKDLKLIEEFRNQSTTIQKDARDSYGRKLSYSTGSYHTLDACRMAVLGWKQRPIEIFQEQQKNTFRPIRPMFVTG